MRIDTFIMGLIMIIGVLGLGLVVIDDQMVKNPAFDGMANSTFGNVTSKITNISKTSGDLQTALEGDLEGEDIFGFLLKSGKSFLTVVWDIFTIPWAFLATLADLHIMPPIVSTLISAALILLVAFAMVYMFFRFQNR